jgi:hypothetical protein
MHASLLTLLIFFLQLLVATLLTKQPFFIGGIDDYDQARGAAYGAMWAYVVSFVISVVIGVREARQEHRESVIMRSNYGQVPSLDLQNYEVDLQDLPSSVEEDIYTTEGVFT